MHMYKYEYSYLITDDKLDNVFNKGMWNCTQNCFERD